MNDATRKYLNLPLTTDAYWPQENEVDTNAPQDEPRSHADRPDIADIIREETQHGRTVVKFLVSAMEGEIHDFKPCHRLDATRQLIKFGYDPAQSFLDAYLSIQGPAPAHMRTRPSEEPEHQLHQDLTRIIAEETQDGRTTVRFLVQVMLGELPEFKPHHRISSAKELLRLGFPVKTEPKAENDPQQPGSHIINPHDHEHDPACDCNSGLVDCYGSPLKHTNLPEGVKGKAERAAFDAAFPDYAPPTDAQKRRIVAEYAFHKNPDAARLHDIPLPLIEVEAQKLFDRDRREKTSTHPP